MTRITVLRDETRMYHEWKEANTFSILSRNINELCTSNTAKKICLQNSRTPSIWCILFSEKQRLNARDKWKECGKILGAEEMRAKHAISNTHVQTGDKTYQPGGVMVTSRKNLWYRLSREGDSQNIRRWVTTTYNIHHYEQPECKKLRIISLYRTMAKNSEENSTLYQ